MEAREIAARAAHGLARAATHLGRDYELFRPSDPLAPLGARSFRAILPAAFHGRDDRWSAGPLYGDALWRGVFDSALTEPGDYLLGPEGCYFIVAQPPLLPPVCVRTNRRISLARADGALATGLNDYGGATDATETLLYRDWPASLLLNGLRQGGGGLVPGESGAAHATLLLPPSAAPTIHPRDVVTDDMDGRFTVAAAERTALGWRVMLIQAAV